MALAILVNNYVLQLIRDLLSLLLDCAVGSIDGDIFREPMKFYHIGFELYKTKPFL